MKLKDIVAAFVSGIAISIKRLLTCNRAIKAINRKAYDKCVEEEISLLEKMYSIPLFAQLLDSAFWYDAFSEKTKHKMRRSLLTDAERSIVNFYLIWKEDENKSLDNSAAE